MKAIEWFSYILNALLLGGGIVIAVISWRTLDTNKEVKKELLGQIKELSHEMLKKLSAEGE